MSLPIQELQEIATFQEVIFADFPNNETLVAEVNRFATMMPNADKIIQRNLSLAIGTRYRSKAILEQVCQAVNVTPDVPYYAYEFTPNPTLQAIIDDKPDDLAPKFDKQNPEESKVKIKIFGREAEIDYLSFAALLGSSSVYNMLRDRNLKPNTLTLAAAVISGNNQMIDELINTSNNPPIHSLLRIALLSFQKDVFSWLLDKFVLPSDELQNLLLFIAKTAPIAEDAFALVGNLDKIEFTFNQVFESDNLQAILACVAKGYVPGPNLSPQSGPMAQYVKQWVISILHDKIKDGSDHRSQVVLGNCYRLSNLNPGPFFEFYMDDCRILRFTKRPSDEPQQGNNYDLVPKEALELFKIAADAGYKAGKQMFEFYRLFGPDEFLPPPDAPAFSFDQEYDKKVFGIDRSAIYVTNGKLYLDEKFYNVKRAVKALEDECNKPDDGTATWRDNNFIYGTAIYAGMVEGKTQQEGADRMIKFALYGYSYHRVYTLGMYAEHNPSLFPPEKVDLDYIKKLTDYYEFLYKRLGYTPNYYKGDCAYSFKA